MPATSTRRRGAAPPAKPKPPAKSPATARALYDGEGNLRTAPQPRLFAGDDGAWRRQIVAKRKEVQRAKAAHSAAGAVVKARQEELEALLQEGDQRSVLEEKKQGTLV